MPSEHLDTNPVGTAARPRLRIFEERVTAQRGARMKIAIRIGGPTSGGREHFETMLELAVEAEKLGVDQAWSTEAWGMDAIVPLAYLAARTTRLKLGTGIMQVCARTPASAAMTALAMHTATEGRFLLGLGNSGPQVVEGLHGQPFNRPLTRMRETVEII